MLQQSTVPTLIRPCLADLSLLAFKPDGAAFPMIVFLKVTLQLRLVEGVATVLRRRGFWLSLGRLLNDLT